jgi:selenocysteine lyase/cysteine desulfurase
MRVEEIREQFPHTNHRIYLDHAATGPVSRPVKEAIDRFIEQRHSGVINNYADVIPQVNQTREKLAQLVGTSADRIAFVANTSTGLNILALGLPWQTGDRIAVPACEFPANVYPFKNLECRGVAVDFIPHDRGVIERGDIARVLRSETRLVSLSWVQFLSGFRLDLAAVADLCHSNDVLLSVDAIQGLGALRLDVESAGIDFLACGTHKWLMGTQGLGFIYLTEGLQERLEPPMAGWLHGPVDWEHLYDYDLTFHEDASRFHLGTMNHLGITALQAALDFYFRIGPAWCEQQVLARSRQLAGGLADLGIPRYGTPSQLNASGIVTVDPGDAEALHAHLRDHEVACAVRNGKLRFSPTFYNTSGEIEHVVALLRQVESTGAVSE